MHVPDIQSGVDKIRERQEPKRCAELLQWLLPSNYPTQHSDIMKCRQAGTGQWFLDAPEVIKWLSDAKGTLFCPGIPGAGKTMLAAIAIDHLLRSARNNSYGVAYVYCNYKDEQDVSSMLAAILKQLVQGHSSALKHIEQLYQKHKQGTRPSIDEICEEIQKVLTYYPTTHIVVDALDECRASDGTCQQFLVKLRRLQAGKGFGLMSTSRFMPDIEDAFKDAAILEVRASKEDVECFVAGQMGRLPKCLQRDIALQKAVQEKIAEATEGM
jgi:Cdc6-like AAA superfamily ATPase